jgi:hypothetical protein
VRANHVRALLGQAPVLNAVEKSAWLGEDPDDGADLEPEEEPARPVICRRCGTVMRLVSSWTAGQLWRFAPRSEPRPP